MSLLAGRRQRPPRPAHDGLLPPTVYEVVAEALCTCLRYTVYRGRDGRYYRQAKRDGRLPAEPTRTLPATPEREAVYALRALLHESLHHPGDAYYQPWQGRRGVKWGDAVVFRAVVDQRVAYNGAGRNGNR
jgi:hypothetical protein